MNSDAHLQDLMHASGCDDLYDYEETCEEDLTDLVRRQKEAEFVTVAPGYYVVWHDASGKLRMTNEPFSTELAADAYAAMIGRDSWVVQEGRQAA